MAWIISSCRWGEVGGTRISDSWLWNWDEMLFVCSLSCLFLSLFSFSPQWKGHIVPKWLEWEHGGLSPQAWELAALNKLSLREDKALCGKLRWVVKGAAAVERVEWRADGAGERGAKHRAELLDAGKRDAGKRDTGTGGLWGRWDLCPETGPEPAPLVR